MRFASYSLTPPFKGQMATSVKPSLFQSVFSRQRTGPNLRSPAFPLSTNRVPPWFM